MRNDEEIMVVAKRLKLVMTHKNALSYFYYDLEKLIDLILENEGGNA
jgi:hypothetical protein